MSGGKCAVFRYFFILGIVSISGCSSVRFTRTDTGPKPEDTKIQMERQEEVREYRPFVVPRRPIKPVEQEVLIVDPDPVVEEQVEQTHASGAEYTIKKGDCLITIARRYGIKLSDLRAANPDVDERKLHVGQKITLPNVSDDEVKRASNPEKYKVQRGDCLSTIAQRYGVSVKAIRLANGLSGDRIVVGKTLTIPERGSAYEFAKEDAVAKKDTGKSSTSASSENSKKLDIDSDGYYTLSKGDVLSVIARRAGVSVSDLQDWNDISDPTKIRAGQKILVRNQGQTITRDSINHSKQVSEQPTRMPDAIPQPPIVDRAQQKYDFLDDADFFNSVDDIPVVQVQG